MHESANIFWEKGKPVWPGDIESYANNNKRVRAYESSKIEDLKADTSKLSS